MREVSKKVKVLLAAMLIITVGNLVVTLYSQVNLTTPKGGVNSQGHMPERIREAKSRFPIADYSAAEPADPEKRAKRKSRNDRHNNSMLGVRGGLNAPPNSGEEIVIRNDWEVYTPQIPAAKSDVVVTGEILDANAYISSDKNGVYSEFTLRIDETLKKDDARWVFPGELISVEREGGQVRYPSNRIEWYRISLQEMPIVNRRYVLFLKRIDEASFSIITGYEMREGRVYPLDGASQFRALEGKETSLFLQSVRDSIAKM